MGRNALLRPVELGAAEARSQAAWCSQLAAGRTDANGIATLTGASVAGLSAGLHLGAVGASFDGDTLFLASSDTANLTLLQIGRP